MAEAQLLKRVATCPRSPGRNRGCRAGPAWRGQRRRPARPERNRECAQSSSRSLGGVDGAGAGGIRAPAQTCLRPKWTECVSFPNGGRHTGVSPYGKPVQLDVPPGAKICVSTEWEIRAENYVLFERDGHAWPDRDWEVEAETFCFYRN